MYFSVMFNIFFEIFYGEDFETIIILSAIFFLIKSPVTSAVF